MDNSITLDGFVGAEYSDYMKHECETRIKELNAMAEEIAKSGEKGEFDYLVSGLSKLTSMMVDCDQFDLDIDPEGDAVLVDRVIKINRYVEKFYLDFHGIDHVNVGGLFLVAPIYLIPIKRYKAYSRKRRGVVKKLEDYGLPTEKECQYGSMKAINGKLYMALARFNNNLLNEVVTSIRHYDYVFLR